MRNPVLLRASASQMGPRTCRPALLGQCTALMPWCAICALVPTPRAGPASSARPFCAGAKPAQIAGVRSCWPHI